MMKNSQNIARWMGILYLIGTAAGILSRVFTAPVVGAPNSFETVASNGNQIILGALCVLIMGMALALIPVVAYPVLRKRNGMLAMGYVVFRGALEGMVYLGIVVSWLLMLPLSQVFVRGELDVFTIQTLTTTLLEAPQLGAVLMIVFSIGGFLLYTLLFQTRLVPRWLAVWGLIAIVMNFVAGLLIMFDLFSAVSEVSTMLQIPIFLQEITMAIWLIIKGFNFLEESK